MIYLLFRNQYFKWFYLLNNIFPSYQILYYFFNNCKMHRKKKDRESASNTSPSITLDFS